MSLQIDSSLRLRGYIESEIGGRSENQDSAGAMDTALGSVVVVCDGMGGMNGGKTASMLAVQTIIDYIAEAKAEESPKDVLMRAFQHANQKIIEASIADPELQGMGTTATALIINKYCATVAHIGDSRIYQFRGKRKVFRTADHSLVFQLVAQEVLTEEQARQSSNSNIILKALGVDQKAVPDISVLPFLKGDRFVLCTDGFWGAFPEPDFIKQITPKGNLNNLLWEVSKSINQVGIASGGGHDNYTAAVVDVSFESIIKPRMSKRNKIILAILTILLLISMFFNYHALVKIDRESSKLDIAFEYAKELSVSADTTMYTKNQKSFMEAFRTYKDTL